MILGGQGRLGRSLAPYLRSIGVETIVGGRSAGADVHIDVTDANDVVSAITKSRPDAVLHLASVTGEAAARDPLAAKSVNVDSMDSVIDASATINARVVYVSSSAVYGDQYSSPVDELAELDPRSVYAQTKIAAEDKLRHASKTGGPQSVILRIFNIYGDSFDESLVYKLRNSTKENPAQLRGLDNFARDYVHVGDVLLPLAHSLSSGMPGATLTVNLGSGHATTNRELITRLSRGGAVHAEERKGSWSYTCADVSLARDILKLDVRHEI